MHCHHLVLLCVRQDFDLLPAREDTRVRHQHIQTTKAAQCLRDDMFDVL